jgi:starvation-inducible DNA-binding protein
MLKFVKKKEMETKNNLIAKMNELLANYQIHYQNLRGLHWNIKGEQFFELHVKYEELYTRTQVIIDELAERILSIGGTPVHQYAKYLTLTNIQELPTVTNGAEGVAYIVNAQETLLKLERTLLQLTDDLADEGTNALMSDLIREKEKTTWMFNAWLNKK